jgi:hypothetical protein
MVPRTGLGRAEWLQSETAPVNAGGESFSGEPDAGNLHVRFGEGEVGRSLSPTSLLYRFRAARASGFSWNLAGRRPIRTGQDADLRHSCLSAVIGSTAAARRAGM